LGKSNLPVVCVNWCDARDYCAWAGKRLCRAQNGQPDDFNAGYADATQSEWTTACSKDGFRVYPYGDMYASATCVDDAFNGTLNDGSMSSAQPEDESAAAGCVGGYANLQHMSGNVWEWTDACQGTGTPKNDQCRDRGGSFWDSDPNVLKCTSAGPSSHTRNYRNKNIGFRCCADAVP
jgi:formylglycine-generating enzyme required for sulfatase activity